MQRRETGSLGRNFLDSEPKGRGGAILGATIILTSVALIVTSFPLELEIPRRSIVLGDNGTFLTAGCLKFWPIVLAQALMLTHRREGFMSETIAPIMTAEKCIINPHISWLSGTRLLPVGYN